MDKIMDEENELLDRTDIENYKNGKYVSEQYTKEEWKKLRLTDTDNIICPIGNPKKSDIGNKSK